MGLTQCQSFLSFPWTNACEVAGFVAVFPDDPIYTPWHPSPNILSWAGERQTSGGPYFKAFRSKFLSQPKPNVSHLKQCKLKTSHPLIPTTTDQLSQRQYKADSGEESGKITATWAASRPIRSLVNLCEQSKKSGGAPTPCCILG